MRIHTFDKLRGYSILLMLIAHVGEYWLNPESEWLVAIYFLLFNFMGTNGFNFTSGLGFGYSWQEYQSNGMDLKQCKKKIFSRTWVLLILSIIYNILATLIRGNGWAGLWYWNILQCIAISRLIGAFMIRIKRKVRFVLSITIIFINPILLYYLIPARETSIFANCVYFILYNPLYANCILIFLPFFLNGTILGEIIHGLIKKKDEKNKYSKTLQLWIVLGVSITIFGLIMGYKGTNYDFGWHMMERINTHPDINITTLPLFLVSNSFAWSLFCSGLQIILCVFLVYYDDFKRKNVNPGLLTPFGLYSLTIYFLQYPILIIPFLTKNLNHKTIWLPLILFILTFWLITTLIHKKTNGKYSIEYLLVKSAQKIYKKTL